MKRLFTTLSVIICIASITSCNVDKSYDLICYFQNDTKNEIIIQCFYGCNDEKAGESIAIPANGENHITFYSFAKVPDFPFCTYGKVVISNNINQVIQYRDIDNTDKGVRLFDAGNYTQIKNEDSYQTYLYVFTDDFFKDGEPLEK